MLGDHIIETLLQLHELIGSRPAVVKQPLDRVLKKSVFESWLKRPRLGLADPKLGTDFELRRAISFDVVTATLFERRAHRV